MDIRKEPLSVLCPKGDDIDCKYVNDVIKSGWWINGPVVKEFEDKFAKMVGKKYAIAVTSNDGQYIEIMNMAEIEKCRQVSKASSSPHSPWTKWFDQMAKKTVIHRIAKRLPKNDAINSVVRIDEDTDFKQAVNVTPTPDKQEQPLSRLKEAMGMANEEVDQAADNVINNYRKEE